MSGDTGRQSSSEVAHEAEGTRANLANTLEQLRTNLRPENVMDEVVSNARVGANTVMDNLAGVAKQHPLPAMLLTAGSALIMRFFAKRDAQSDGTGFEPLERRPLPARSPVELGTGRRPPLLRPASATPASGRSALATATAGLAEVREGVADSLSTTGADLKRRAYEAYDATSSRAGDAVQNVSRYIPHDRTEVRSKLSHLLEEQPLILGAIGLAVGAAIGAALPMTVAEDSLMGTTAHRFRESAQDVARSEIDGIRAAAGDAVDHVRHSASDFVKDLGDSAKTVVDKAGTSLDTASRDV